MASRLFSDNGFCFFCGIQAFVIRDGELQDVDSADLVPGDIVQLRVGDRVPADCRVIRLEAGPLTAVFECFT